MAMSQPLIGLLDGLKRDNEILEELRHLHHRLNQGEQLDGFRRENELLIYEDRYFIRAESKLKDLLLAEFHNTPSPGHGGTKKMLLGLSALFYWQGMRKSIKEFIPVWDDVSMDFITGLPASKGLKVILVVVDQFSKYTHFGTSQQIVAELSEEDHAGHPLERTLAICDTRLLTEFQAAYPSYHLEDKVMFEGVGNVTPESDEPHDEEPTDVNDEEPTDANNESRLKRATSRRVWFKDYVIR
nr:hypothetical protein [Tanacetum cinerariifolium]